MEYKEFLEQQALCYSLRLIGLYKRLKVNLIIFQAICDELEELELEEEEDLCM